MKNEIKDILSSAIVLAEKEGKKIAAALISDILKYNLEHLITLEKCPLYNETFELQEDEDYDDGLYFSHFRHVEIEVDEHIVSVCWKYTDCDNYDDMNIIIWNFKLEFEY